MTSHVIPFLKGNIHCISEGKGRCIVLLHGFLGSTEIWKYTIPYLSKSYKVIAIDLPGHGKTDCFGYAHSMELMADAVHAVLKYFRIKNCVLIGHSMGGYVALAFTKKYPHIIKGLCLFHSTAYPDTEEKKKDRNRAIKIVQKNSALFVRPMIRNLFAKNNLKYLKEELKMATRIALNTSPQGIIAALIGMRDRPSSVTFIQETRLPILLIIGKKDNVLPFESLLQQCEMIQNKECLILEYDGHFGMLENPKATALAIRKFVRKCFQK
ncbi:MAG: alpha/beta fold hydrolase [Bacteroidetes bacterium]|nr:MAG: alpha/beta fold hydrolase [Bacteroidota bacterium]